MPRVKFAPKWLAFLIPISLSFAALSTAGCSSDDDTKPTLRPDLSQEAGIESIAFNKGTLNPSYRESVRNYSVGPFHTETSGLSLTVTLKDARARLTINGEQARNAAPFPLELAPGASTITVSVMAEDGKNHNIVTLTTELTLPNTRVYVLDGLGGAPVEGAMVTLKDAYNRTLEADIPLPAGKQGSMLLGLDPLKKYHIYAKGTNSAEACFAYFDPSKEDTVELYCLPGWKVAPYVSEAPVIERISFADNFNTNALWKDVPFGENRITGKHTEFPFVRITAISKNPIIYDDGVGTVGPAAFPIQVAMDGKAWEESRFITWLPVEAAAPVMVGGAQYFRTTYAFPMPYTYVSDDGEITYAQLSTPDHWLDIVVYDQANNRTEQRLYLTLADASPQYASDTNISALMPRLTLQGQTYGISMNVSGANPVEIQGVSPVEGYGVTYYNVVAFNLTQATVLFPDPYYIGVFPAIRGFEVYRSTDNVNFNKIETIHYAAANRGVYYTGGTGSSSYGQRFAYTDFSPELTENVTYYYRVRAFNANPAEGGYSPMSNSLGNKLLPAFVTQLTAPAHNSVSDKLWPTFRFRVTSPGLLKSNTSDHFFFGLTVKDVTTQLPTFILPIWVDFTELDDAGDPRISYGIRPMWSLYVSECGYYDAVYEAEDENGNIQTKSFIRLEDDGTIVIESDNEGFQHAVFKNYEQFSLDEYELTPGRTYEWTIFGENGGLPGIFGVNWEITESAYFYKAWPSTPGNGASDAFSFGSNYDYGLGSPNGFFLLIIDPATE
ncbi:MAG: hypothetical protein LBQ86_05215 [Holophagales bacterium]|jgi:hypothetical protein|nr:hypothetical protein [Holophagales bacterium]